MANWHWLFKLAVIALVGAIDYEQGKALVGFVLAGAYLAGALFSLMRGDKRMFKKRIVIFALFVAEVMVIASLVESPPDFGILQKWTDKLAR